MSQEVSSQPVRRSRRGLQGKVILGVVVLVTVSTGACGYFTSYLGVRQLRNTITRDARMLTDTGTRYLASKIINEPYTKEVELIEEMIIDSRVSFVVMRDTEGNPVARRVSEPESWWAYAAEYEKDPKLDASTVSVAQWIALPHGELVAYTLPIWLDDDDNRRHLYGFLTMAVRDPAMSTMIVYARAGTAAIVVTICVLSLLPTVLITYRWVQPLRQMMRESRRLAAGKMPETLDDDRGDEIGELMAAFNGMAGKLYLARTALENANVALEQKVEERTRALRLVNNQLELQMKDKDEFIRAITHDLNAPLRNIEGMTQLLIRKHGESLPAEAQTKLERILANAVNESEMLNDLLELSRVRSRPGKDHVVDLVELSRQVIGSLEFEIGERGIEVSVEGPMPTVIADRNRMRQVYQNLLENAVKYMPAEKSDKRVVVGCRLGGDAPVFYVSDTGRGIDPQDEHRVFQVFQRARYSGEHSEPGRGVGLASVKTIIEHYGGRVWIDRESDSDWQAGTTFCFTIGPQHVSRSSQTSQSLPSRR